MGASGEAISREVQPASRTGAPLWSRTLQAVMEFLDGAASQCAPVASCQLAIEPETTAGYAAPVMPAASTRCKRPSAVAAAIIVFLLYSKITGDETNAWPPAR